jgi:hypothetical protein
MRDQRSRVTRPHHPRQGRSPAASARAAGRDRKLQSGRRVLSPGTEIGESLLRGQAPPIYRNLSENDWGVALPPCGPCRVNLFSATASHPSRPTQDTSAASGAGATPPGRSLGPPSDTAVSPEPRSTSRWPIAGASGLRRPPPQKPVSGLQNPSLPERMQNLFLMPGGSTRTLRLRGNGLLECTLRDPGLPGRWDSGWLHRGSIFPAHAWDWELSGAWWADRQVPVGMGVWSPWRV